MSSVGDYEYVFLKLKCSKQLTTGGMQAMILWVEEIGNRSFGRRPGSPYIVTGARLDGEVWDSPNPSGAQGREKLVSLVGNPSGLVSTSSYGHRGLAPYAKAWHTVATLCQSWWHYAIHDGAMGVVVVHQLPCTTWARCRHHGLRPSVRFFREKS
jgi:hypothetical protein